MSHKNEKLILLCAATLLLATPQVVFPQDSDEGESQKTFFASVHSGDFEAVRNLLTSEQIDADSEDGAMALAIASQWGHENIAELLLESGASPNETLTYGKTALLQAASYGHRGILGMLLESGADPDIADDDGTTPLLVASQSGRADIVEQLIEAGAKTNAAGKNGNTPLHYAASVGSIDIIDLILDANNWLKAITGSNVDINKKNGLGHTPLMLAYDRWNYHVVNKLVEEGASTYDYELRIAAMNNDLKTVDSLLKKGANIDSSGSSSHVGGVRTTALLAAAMQGHEEMIQLLLSRGSKRAEGVVNLIGYFALKIPFYARGELVSAWELAILESRIGSKASSRYVAYSSEGELRFIEYLLDPGAKRKRDEISALLSQYREL